MILSEQLRNSNYNLFLLSHLPSLSTNWIKLEVWFGGRNAYHWKSWPFTNDSTPEWIKQAQHLGDSWFSRKLNLKVESLANMHSAVQCDFIWRCGKPRQMQTHHHVKSSGNCCHWTKRSAKPAFKKNAEWKKIGKLKAALTPTHLEDCIQKSLCLSFSSP